MRMRSHWYKQDRVRTDEETAGSLAFIYWQIATDRIKSMEAAGFYIDLPVRTLDVVSEFLAFLLHVTDRKLAIMYEHEKRSALISALAAKLVDVMRDNRQDSRDGKWQSSQFVALLNSRMSDYAGLPYEQEGPSYSMFLLLGNSIASVVGKDYNRWAIEQIIDIEAPQSVVLLNKAMRDLVEPAKESPPPSNL